MTVLWKFWHSSVLELRSSNQGTTAFPLVMLSVQGPPWVWASEVPINLLVSVPQASFAPRMWMNANSSPMPARTGAPAPTTMEAMPVSVSTAGAGTTAARTSTIASLPPVPTAPPASTGWLPSPAFVQRERQVRAQNLHEPGRCFLGFMHLFKAVCLFHALRHQKEKHCPWPKSC